VHGVGGYLGITMLGIFASTAWNPAASGGVDGLLRGNPHFFLVQLGSVSFASAWALIFTLGMLWLINQVTPVRVSDMTEEIGLDEGIHGEHAYELGT
jgi:Amt family ammonium transporter